MTIMLSTNGDGRRHCLKIRLRQTIDKIFPDDIIGVLNDYKSAVEKLSTMILDDARKEFDDSAKIGYEYRTPRASTRVRRGACQ